MDSTNRLWLAYDTADAIEVRYSDAPYSIWAEPIQLQTGISSDDLCASTAFIGGSIGVMWSDQVRGEFGFRMHQDGDTPEEWSAKENAAARAGDVDDHIHLVVDNEDNMYAVVKTTSGSDIGCYKRYAEGNWSSIVILDSGTRGIGVLDEVNERLYVIYDGGSIKYRIVDTKTLAFGPAQDMIPGGDPTSTKQNIGVIGQFVVISSYSSIAYSIRYSQDIVFPALINFQPIAAIPPPACYADIGDPFSQERGYGWH